MFKTTGKVIDKISFFRANMLIKAARMKVAKDKWKERGGIKEREREYTQERKITM